MFPSFHQKSQNLILLLIFASWSLVFSADSPAQEGIGETGQEAAAGVGEGAVIEAEASPGAAQAPPEDEAPADEAKEEAAEEARDREAPTESGQKQVYGWKEWVRIGTKADLMRAKLDSGARTSSLHAEGIEEFERDGRQWVQFVLLHPNQPDSKRVLIKAPVERIAKVKNTDGTLERRFVVELNFQIGKRQMREEFTLNDRTGLTCPVLIGRNALRHMGYLDCSRVDLAEKTLLK
ncbi:MAG: RimK/LysX family protein [Verrucomicrobiota bacterium JB023]|nr:RimK/LysX family protein [Verrucomicrobiota bacterium JB023]